VSIELTLISLIPFVLGVAIAPFDSQGRFLQYYPFRLADIMLPLTPACYLPVPFRFHSQVKKRDGC
jgi:hypothetical protein